MCSPMGRHSLKKQDNMDQPNEKPLLAMQVEDKSDGVHIIHLTPEHLNDANYRSTRTGMVAAVPETNLKFSDAGKPPHIIVDVSALNKVEGTSPELTRLGSALVDVNSKLRKQHMLRGEMTVVGGNDEINKMIAATGLGILMHVAPTVEKALNPDRSASRAG
jgi:hypothetical protein